MNTSIFLDTLLELTFKLKSFLNNFHKRTTYFVNAILLTFLTKNLNKGSLMSIISKIRETFLSSFSTYPILDIRCPFLVFLFKVKDSLLAYFCFQELNFFFSAFLY